jgi:hypothetical protein
VDGHRCGILTAVVTPGARQLTLDPMRCDDVGLSDGCTAYTRLVSGVLNKTALGVDLLWAEDVKIACSDGSSVTASGSISFKGEVR